MKVFALACLLTMLPAGQTLQAQGILFVQQDTRDGKTNTNEIRMDKTHIRAEFHASTGGSAFTFDAGTKVARVISIEKKTYFELDQAQMLQIRQQMAKMEEQMKNLPPQQREMMEQMMRGRGGIPGMGAPARPDFRQSGSDKVGQWSCTKYEGFRGSEKVSEVCTVDPGTFGLTPADFTAATQLAEFMKSMMPQLADQSFVYGTQADQGFSGVPVRRTSYENGKVVSVSEIKEFRREAFPPSTWETPAGFKKQTMPGMPAR